MNQAQEDVGGRVLLSVLSIAEEIYSFAVGIDDKVFC